MSERSTIDRQLRLLRILSSRRLGVTVVDLNDELGVSLKTIRRDLTRLQDAGFPLTEQSEDHGRRRWSLAPAAANLTGAGLGFDEAFALLLSAGAIGSLGGTTLGQAAASAVAKLRSGLSENVLRYCDRLARSVVLTECRDVDYGDKADIVEQILLGHEDRKNVFIAYHSRSSTEPVTYPISPYAIRKYQNAVYVIGNSEQHNEIRTFKLDRISEADVTKVPFQIPANFDADQYLSTGFGIFAGTDPVEVKIRLAPESARFIAESKWHATQQLAPQPDGSQIATYNVSITPELIGWILSIGPDAKVIQPDALAD
ncbi:MAG: WYL domain-containing protein, partial [Rubripirellula sp.]